MKIGENVEKYFLIMKELPARGEIQIKTFIKYVTDRINYEVANKAILLQANTQQRLKKKMKAFEEIR